MGIAVVRENCSVRAYAVPWPKDAGLIGSIRSPNHLLDSLRFGGF